MKSAFKVQCPILPYVPNYPGVPYVWMDVCMFLVNQKGKPSVPSPECSGVFPKTWYVGRYYRYQFTMCDQYANRDRPTGASHHIDNILIYYCHVYLKKKKVTIHLGLSIHWPQSTPGGGGPWVWKWWGCEASNLKHEVFRWEGRHAPKKGVIAWEPLKRKISQWGPGKIGKHCRKWIKFPVFLWTCLKISENFQ